MNRLYILLTIILFTSACEKENDTNLKDEFTSNTRWETKRVNLHPNTPYMSDSIVPTETYTQWFPTFKAPEVNYMEDSDVTVLLSEEEHESLNFNLNDCEYTSQKYQLHKNYHIKDKYAKVTHFNQICIGHVGEGTDTLKIVPDGIYIHYDRQYYEDEQHIHKMQTLNNYKSTVLPSENIVSVKIDTLFEINSKELFSFQRTKNEIIMQNDDKRLVGKINENEWWTMSLTQVYPEKKETTYYFLTASDKSFEDLENQITSR